MKQNWKIYNVNIKYVNIKNTTAQATGVIRNQTANQNTSQDEKKETQYSKT